LSHTDVDVSRRRPRSRRGEPVGRAARD